MSSLISYFGHRKSLLMMPHGLFSPSWFFDCAVPASHCLVFRYLDHYNLIMLTYFGNFKIKCNYYFLVCLILIVVVILLYVHPTWDSFRPIWAARLASIKSPDEMSETLLRSFALRTVFTKRAIVVFSQLSIHLSSDCTML